MNRRQVGLAILRGALGQLPLVGGIGVEWIRSWEMSELIGERVDRALEARFATLLPRIIEALISHANGVSQGSVTTGMIEALSEQAVARLEPGVREALADQARQLSAAPDDREAAEYAATLVGQVLDQPEVRTALTMPLLAGPGAIRVEEGAVLAGRYRVVGVLGLGAHATVYHARDDQDGRDVAIKIGAEPGPGWQRQLHREGLRLARLDHPGIVRVHETITVAVGPESKPLAAIVMDLIDGSTLRAHVAERGGRLPWSKARPLIEGLLGALEHAHSQGILHLDVKPDNIMVLDGGRAAKVLDFGLARATGEEKFTKLLGGTPGYIAPELTRPGEPTKAADVFSAGAVAYELLAGSLPDVNRLVPLRDHGVDVTPSVDAAIRRALEPMPSHRHGTAAAFWAALGAPATGSPETSKGATLEVQAPAGFPELRPVAKGRLLRLTGAFPYTEAKPVAAFETKHVAIAADGSVIAVNSPTAIRFMRPDGSSMGAPVPATKVERLVLSANGRMCAAAAGESVKLEDYGQTPTSIRVWSVETGHTIFDRRMKGHTRVALSTDGFLISGGPRADEVGAWDLETGAPRWTRPFTDVRDVSVSSDSAHVLVSMRAEQALLTSSDGREIWRRSLESRTEPGDIARGIVLPGARVLTWETNRTRVEQRGKKKETVCLSARLFVTNAEGATVRRHDTATYWCDGQSMGVAGDVVYWLDAGPSSSPMLKALDLRSGLEIESLDLGPSKVKFWSATGNVSLAACATRVALLAERGPSNGLLLAYEPI